VARHYTSDKGYKKRVLGIADDIQDADGLRVLTFGQAQESARKWFGQRTRKAEGKSTSITLPDGEEKEIAIEDFTVGNALDSYLKDFRLNKKGYVSVERNVEVHIRPALGEVKTNDLHAKQIKKFRNSLATAPGRLRTAKGQPQRYRPTPVTDDQRRQRKATANKILSTLKAALNSAWRDGDIDSDEAWRRVEPFLDVDQPRIRYLNMEECRRLINACEPGFRQLVQAALFSGCRYGELRALLVSDYNSDSGLLTIAAPKAGGARHVALTDEGQLFFDGMALGRAGDETMFIRIDEENLAKRPWGKSHQTRPLKTACEHASIRPAVSFHILRHSYATALLRNHVPLVVVSKNLGHADVRMTLRHYGHLADKFVADEIRAGAADLGVASEHTSVAPFNPLRTAKQ